MSDVIERYLACWNATDADVARPAPDGRIDLVVGFRDGVPA